MLIRVWISFHPQLCWAAFTSGGKTFAFVLIIGNCWGHKNVLLAIILYFPKPYKLFLLHSWDIWKMCTSAYEASENIRLKLTLPISCLFGSLRIWAPRSPTMHRWLCFLKSCLELGSPTFYRCSHCSPWTLLLPLRLPWWLTWLAGEELMFGSYVQITLHQAVLLSWELGLTAAIALLVCFLMHLYLCGTDREQQNQLMLSRNHFLHVRTVSGVALLY